MAKAGRKPVGDTYIRFILSEEEKTKLKEQAKRFLGTENISQYLRWLTHYMDKKEQL